MFGKKIGPDDALDQIMNRIARAAGPFHIGDEDFTAEEKIAQLRAAADLYGKPCRFKLGDLVTPRGNTGTHDPGSPWLVIEVLTEPLFVTDKGIEDSWMSSAWGVRLDMRCLHTRGGGPGVHAHWVESFEFDFWPPAIDAKVEHGSAEPFEGSV